MDRMTALEAEQLGFWVTSEGDICERTCGDPICCTEEPERLTLVLQNGSTFDDWALLGGCAQAHELLARLSAFVEDDSQWTGSA